MSEHREFHFVIFGATGFTGKHVVEYVAKIPDEIKGMKWAVAGRSKSKLKQVLDDVSSITGKDVRDIPIVEADVNVSSSLTDMCKRSQLILNCVGPYRFFGEVVVKACVENGAHHIDVSGEPEFLETMQLQYNEAAKNANVFILGAAGFDSIPCEMGIQYLRENFKGDVNSVETFLSLKHGPQGMRGNFGTWQSAVHGVASYSKLRPIRQKLFTSRPPKSAHLLTSRGILFKDENVGKWCVPFPVTDKSVVSRTQYYNYHNRKMRPVQMLSYLTRPNVFHAIATLVFGAVFGIMAYFRLGRFLLETYPTFFSVGMFSKDGPTREQIEGTSFKLTLVGSGYESKLSEPEHQHANPPNKKIIVSVSGPEPGYVTTPICMMQVALAVLRESDKLPKVTGVMTPGAALFNTSLIAKLQNHKILFDIVKNEC